MILLIDNYDSFTHNLYQFLREIDTQEIKVVRNDAITVEDIKALNPSAIVISPGPGRPEEAGISVDTIKEFSGTIPILGVCLGHQSIAYAFGARIAQAREIVHGKAQEISLDGQGLFRSISNPSSFTRYHSLAVDESTLPSEFEITARSADGEIMGIRHKDYVLEGVQFHPESIASEAGKKLLRNFIHYRREPFVAKEMLSSIISGKNMSQNEASSFMEELTEGNLSDIQIAGFLTAISTKGIVPEEIAGCAAVLQKKRTPLNMEVSCLDTCGTGGDGLGTFNISSLSALIAASAGAKVAKHGNRAVSSKSGSADFYRALGIEIDLSPGQSQELLERNGFAFLFAPIFHSAMRFAAPARKELKIKTIMNLLGPLVNPAAADYQLIGVYSEELVPIMAQAAHLLGIKSGMIVHGRDGLDELSITTTSKIAYFTEDGSITEEEFQPEEVGIKPYPLNELKGGDAATNAELAKQIIHGQGVPAIRDSVLLNAGAALKVYGIADSIKDGYEKAKTVLEDGSVAKKLEDTIYLSQNLKQRG